MYRQITFHAIERASNGIERAGNGIKRAADASDRAGGRPCTRSAKIGRFLHGIETQIKVKNQNLFSPVFPNFL